MHIARLTYLVMDKLCDIEIFQVSSSQQKVAVNRTTAVLEAEDFMFVREESCSLYRKKICCC